MCLKDTTNCRFFVTGPVIVTDNIPCVTVTNNVPVYMFMSVFEVVISVRAIKLTEWHP